MGVELPQLDGQVIKRLQGSDDQRPHLIPDQPTVAAAEMWHGDRSHALIGVPVDQSPQALGDEFDPAWLPPPGFRWEAQDPLAPIIGPPPVQNAGPHDAPGAEVGVLVIHLWPAESALEGNPGTHQALAVDGDGHHLTRRGENVAGPIGDISHLNPLDSRRGGRSARGPRRSSRTSPSGGLRRLSEIRNRSGHEGLGVRRLPTPTNRPTR